MTLWRGFIKIITCCAVSERKDHFKHSIMKNLTWQRKSSPTNEVSSFMPPRVWLPLFCTTQMEMFGRMCRFYKVKKDGDSCCWETKNTTIMIRHARTEVVWSEVRRDTSWRGKILVLCFTEVRNSYGFEPMAVCNERLHVWANRFLKAVTFWGSKFHNYFLNKCIKFV